MRPSRLTQFRVGTFVLIWLSLLIVGIGCSSDDETGQPTGAPAPSTQMVEYYNFKALPEMIATADIVITGTVALQEDRQLVPAIAGKTPALNAVLIEVKPDEIMTGSLETPTIVIQIDEHFLAYVGDTTWTEAGQRSLLFLRKKEHSVEPLYFLSNSQGVYRIDSQGELDGVRASDELVEQISALSLQDVRGQVESARVQIARGELLPQVFPPVRNSN
ncbi:MAG: hypothetical protein QF898_09745 [SAR202 cluster bacterium]|jgi:hypothetical protein|nr:hypothetical protein [SAR202 cluster bacterium]